MSSSCSTEKCPKCGKESLFVDYECRTGEYDTFCEFCGFGQHFSWVRDDNFDIVRVDTTYPMSEVYLMVKNYRTDEIYLKICVLDIPNFSTESVDKYLNHVDGYRFDEFDDGFNNFYWVHGDEVKQLYYRGNELDVDIENKTIVVHEVKTEFEEIGGYGHLLMFEDTCSKGHRFDENTTREEALIAIGEAKKNRGLKEMLATWYNKESGEFEILHGAYRENWDGISYSEYSSGDGNISEDDFPF